MKICLKQRHRSRTQSRHDSVSLHVAQASLSCSTAHERAHKANDKRDEERFRWPWEKIANRSLNFDTDDDDVVMSNTGQETMSDT